MHLGQAQFGGREMKGRQTYTECYRGSIRRRDYSREVALSQLAAETETYVSPQYSNTTKLVNWKYQGSRPSLCHPQGASLCYERHSEKHVVAHTLHADVRHCSQAQSF